MKEYRSKEIYGDFYKNAGKPLVVLIGGSRPGLPAPLSDKLMDYLKENFNVFLIAYFGVGELNKGLEKIPMEYFINAINYIKKENNIDDDKVVIIGQSRGGEAALVLGELMQSAATIACVASCYRFQGLPANIFDLAKGAEPVSAWTYNNEELPYIKFYFDEDTVENAKNKKFCKCHKNSIKNNFIKEAEINVDNYKGKILMLSAENDNYWPSKNMSQRLIENSKNKDNMKHVCLDLEGHCYLKYDESVDEIINYVKELSL